jgi:hypothetical protein
VTHATRSFTSYLTNLVSTAPGTDAPIQAIKEGWPDPDHRAPAHGPLRAREQSRPSDVAAAAHRTGRQPYPRFLSM